MTSSRIRCWQRWLLVSVTTGGAIAVCGNKAFAQGIVVDNSPETSLGTIVRTIDNNNLEIVGGTQVGEANLFHSFQEFNIGELQRVDFQGVGIENIFSRVVGGNPSNILGTLGVNGEADLFLLNPSGIIFGPNAQLNLNGSFVGTTASAIGFPNGGEFSLSSVVATDNTLLRVDPSALLLNQINQIPSGSIINQSQLGLEVPAGESLLLVGGDVTLDGGEIRAPGGRVELGGLSQQGVVGIESDDYSLTFPLGVARADVVLNDQAFVDVVSGGGGDITITAGNIEVLSGSRVFAGIEENTGSSSTVAGNIVFDATGLVRVSGESSQIRNNLGENATGNAGNIFEAIVNNNLFGSIIIGAESFELSDSALISTTSFGDGSAGIAFVAANSEVVIDNGIIFTQIAEERKGDAGGIWIQAGSIALINDSELTSSAFGEGTSGLVLLDADGNILIDNSGVFSTVKETAIGGNALGIVIEAGSLSLNNGATVSTTNLASGLAGTILLSAIEEISILNNSTLSSEGNNGNIIIGESEDFDSTFSPQVVRIDNSSLTTKSDVGNAGDISIDAIESIVITDIGLDDDNTPRFSSNTTANQVDAGEISLHSDGSVAVVNSIIASEVEAGAIANAGTIEITASSISLTEQSQLRTLVFGEGEAGTIFLQTNGGTVSLDDSNIFSNVEAGGKGTGGLIEIETRSLFLNNGAQLQTLIREGGEGNAGRVFLQTNGGIIALDNSSTVFSTIEAEGKGTGGDIEINTGSLFLNNGAQLQTLVRESGEGDAGNVTVNATDAVVITGMDQEGFPSAIFSSIGSGAMGNAGVIEVDSNSLSVANGARISTNTFGQGDAGLVSVKATELVSLSGANTFIFSNVESGGRGTAGGVIVDTSSLQMSDGAQMQTLIRKGGQGDAGIIVVQTNGGSVALTGSNTGIFSTIEEEAEGNTGNNEFAGNLFDVLLGTATVDEIVGSIFIDTGTLSVTDGAALTASTLGKGNAGAVAVLAEDHVSLERGGAIFSAVGENATGIGGGIIISADSLAIEGDKENPSGLTTQTLGKGDAGLILVVAEDEISLEGEESGIFSTVAEGLEQTSGAIILETESFWIEDGAVVSVNNQGLKEAGLISITARDLILIDEGKVTATTASGDGGNINLEGLEDFLLLLTGSEVSTEAGQNGFPGIGGNVDIDVQFVIAAPFNDNNISAEAFTGPGGNIFVTADRLYDIDVRVDNPLSNDITASSNAGVDGIEEVNQGINDPTQGLSNLPSELIDSSGLIAQTCAPRRAGQPRPSNKFIVTGRGGLPPDPTTTLPGEAIVSDWGTLSEVVGNHSEQLNANNFNNQNPVNTASEQEPALVEAQGWVYGADGKVIFTAQALTIKPHIPSLIPASNCNDL
ncbi:MAG: filamentous hemagglutinin N-terminal domain-containing protein [Symploca sp. SIO3C6]|nr:filamentous hemagglutinin N-terminal domain-containing protein [Symploca sp. SIO3C6]